MNKFLNSIPIKTPSYNRFDLSHEHKLSCNMGELIPVAMFEAIPGDKITMSQDCLLRMMPMIAPVMHRVDVSFHRYKVPMRLLWQNFEKWITNNEGSTAGMPEFPRLVINQDNYTRLHDHLGIPSPRVGQAELVNAMPMAAYQLIWQEYYRDQNLQDPLVQPQEFLLVDGVNEHTNLSPLRRRCWEHDYFTSSLPFAQKGQPVDVPLGDVVLKDDLLPEQYQITTNHNLGPNLPINTAALEGQPGVAGTGTLKDDAGQEVNIDPNGTLEVQPTTINELRIAFALQRWYEKAARIGSRFTEWLKGMFGVTSSDARLQRPEWIGGEKKPVIISEVLNTTGTDSVPQGSMAGHGVTYLDTATSNSFVEEHSIIMVIMSVMPRTGYFQGLEKLWNKYVHPTQYFTPDFAHIGEQEVLRKEIFAYQGDAGDDTFGYMPRYAEYRTVPNKVSGQMKSSLLFWHMARQFDTPPELTEEFVVCEPTNRIFAVEDPSEDKLVVHVIHHIWGNRKIPKFGVPMGL